MNNKNHECNEEEMFVIEIEDENGETIACPITDEFEYNDNRYYLAYNEAYGSSCIFKLVGEELIIPEDEEFDEVVKYYNEVLVEQK